MTSGPQVACLQWRHCGHGGAPGTRDETTEGIDVTDRRGTSAPTTTGIATGDGIATGAGEVAGGPSRRTVLRMVGAGGAIATVTFVAGCGSEKKSEGSGEDTAKVQAAVQQAVSGGKVPVGSGVVLEDVGAVVTQPTAGQYHVFSSTCPHAGGKVTTFEEGTGRPVCVLHGSVFDATTVDVVAGPSPKGIAKIDVPVSGATAAS